MKTRVLLVSKMELVMGVLLVMMLLVMVLLVMEIGLVMVLLVMEMKLVTVWTCQVRCLQMRKRAHHGSMMRVIYYVSRFKSPHDHSRAASPCHRHHTSVNT